MTGPNEREENDDGHEEQDEAKLTTKERYCEHLS